MAKFLATISYSQSAIQGLRREGAVNRRATVTKVIESLGGNVDGLYFTFGEDDAIVLVDLPGNVTAAAISLAVGGSGAGRIKTTALLSAEEMDEAINTTVDYRPPGG